MPYTARVSGRLARYLLENPNAGVRRRLGVLRTWPFPPGSRSLAADAAWGELSQHFPELRGYIYGSSRDAVVYTYDTATESLVARMAIIDDRLVP